MASAPVLERITKWEEFAAAEPLHEPVSGIDPKDSRYALTVKVVFGHPSPDNNPPSWYHLNPGNLEKVTAMLQCNRTSACEGSLCSTQSHTSTDPDNFQDADADDFQKAGEGSSADVASASDDVEGAPEDEPRHTVWCTFSWGSEGPCDDSSRVEETGKQLGTLIDLLANQDAATRIKAASGSHWGDSLLKVVQGHVAELHSQRTKGAPLRIVFEFNRASGDGQEDMRLGVNWAEFKGSLPRGSPQDPDPRNCWMIPKGSKFTVKGETFFKDGAKVEAGDPLGQLVAVDWHHHSERISGVCERKGGLVQRVRERHGAKQSPFFIAVNLQVPAGSSGHFSMVSYFALQQDSPCLKEGTLLHRFINGDDDAFRKQRLGLIPAIPDGSWFIRNAVGNGTVVTLGDMLSLSYKRGEGFLEIDVNMGTSSTVSGIMGLVIPCLSVLTVDMAFFVKAEEGDPLPESIFGVVRVCNLEQSSAVDLK